LTQACATWSCKAKALAVPPVATRVCGMPMLWKAKAISAQWNGVVPPLTSAS